MNIPVLSDLRHDPDPLPRPAPVGPGSLYRSVADAVVVEPRLIEVVPASPIEARRERRLGSWRFAPGHADDHESPPDLFAGRPVAVPHTWSRSEPELVDFRGPCWYGTGVMVDPGRRHQLRFDGLDYVATVHTAHRLLGHHEGGFTPVAFDLPDDEVGEVGVAVRIDDFAEPALVGPKPLTDAKRKVKGVFEFHDSRPGGHSHGVWFSPLWGVRWGTGGMVEPAVLVSTGDVRLDATFVHAGGGRIAISWVLVNLAATPVDVELRSVIDGSAGVRVVANLPLGPSRVAVQGLLEGAAPWAPVAGPGHVAAVHELATEVLVGGEVSDADRTRFGVRIAEMPLEPDDQFRIRIDGRRTYVRGANYIPGVWIPELTERTFRVDLELAAATGVNSFGPHAHVLPERFYDAADEAGMLVYQDFPLNLANDPDGAPLFDGGPTMGEASLLLAAEVTYRLFNHPSVVYWCGHNEPAYQLAQVFGGGEHPNPLIRELGHDLAAAPDEEPFDDARVEQWNRIDPTRAAFKASGLGRHRPVGDSHTYTGSLNVDPTTAVSNASATFMSEFGAWTTNFSAEGSAPGASGSWPPDEATVGDWEQRTHMWQGTTAKTGRPERYPDYPTFTYASQLWAGTWLKMAVESFRRHKWDPQGAHRYHLFVDHWGDAGAGVIDKHRLPQLHYWALAAAHRLVLPVVGVTPSMRAEPGVELVLPTWVCNDLDRPVTGRLSWSLRRLGGDEAYVIGIDDPKVPTRFAEPVIPRGDLVVIPRGPGTEVAAGEGAVSVDADDVASGPDVCVTPPPSDEPEAYAILLSLALDDGEVVDSWGAFVAAPPAWEAAPGITPMPRFTLSVRGGGPFRLVRRWTGTTVCTGSSDARLTDLPPGQYLLEIGGRVLPIDVYGDLTVDGDAGTAVADGVLPWTFSPLGRF